MQTIDKQNQQIRFRTLSRIWRVLTLTTMILTLEQLSFRTLARNWGGSNITLGTGKVVNGQFPSPREDMEGSNGLCSIE